jgi:hypothetical protein
MKARLELAALRSKYREMQRLRSAQDADVAAGRDHAPSRDELRALAREFPGALAEIDRIPPTVLARRAHELDALLAHDPLPPAASWPVWIRGWLGVHRGLRGALAIKAWLAGRRVIDADTERALAQAMPQLSFADEARDWLDALPDVAAPPRGRLVDLVFDRVARELAIDVPRLRALLMPRIDEATPGAT